MHTKTLALIVPVALATVLSTTSIAQPAPQPPSQPCPAVRDVLITNGRIHTMDTNDTVVESVRISGDRFSEVGTARTPTTRCTRTIDLEGRTAVPGLIDNHNHIVLLGLRPGHDTRLESAASISDVLATLAARAQALSRRRMDYVDRRLRHRISSCRRPARRASRRCAELDAVTPNHPVYIQMSFAGPSVTNSLGKRFFEQAGIEVGAGRRDRGRSRRRTRPRARCSSCEAVRRSRTRSAARMMRSLRGEPRPHDASRPRRLPGDRHAMPTAPAHFDRYHAYDALLALHDEGALTQRIRINFLHMETDVATPELAARLKNVFPHSATTMLKIVGIGEFTAGAAPILGARERRLGRRHAARRPGRLAQREPLADARRLQGHHRRLGAGQHGLPAARHHAICAGSSRTCRSSPRSTSTKLKALGGGVSVLGGWRYISGTAQQNGPPFKMLEDSGIPMGMSSDGMQISPMNPWLGLYYVVTGKNARGELINAGQTLERKEALQLYTAANGWFLHEERPARHDRARQVRGSRGALGATTSTAKPCADEGIKKITSVLTVVGGQVVFGDADRLAP